MNSSTAKASLPKGIDRTLLLGLFEQMIWLPRSEPATPEKGSAGEMTFVHRCIGDEATAVASAPPNSWRA